jgi:hypothetical protein
VEMNGTLDRWESRFMVVQRSVMGRIDSSRWIRL